MPLYLSPISPSPRSPEARAFVMRFLEYAKKYGVSVAVFRIGDGGDMATYEQKAVEYFGRSFYSA